MYPKFSGFLKISSLFSNLFCTGSNTTLSFIDVDLLSNDETLYQYYNNLDPTTVRNIESLSKRTDIVACVSVTHSYFSLYFDRILELAPNAVVVIEEAHQYVGCGD